MAVYVKDLFESVRYEDIHLVAGKNGINKHVRWVHMVETIDISNDLDGNEIVFTTGVGRSHNDNLLDFVRSVYLNSASAMVINVGPYIKEIPQEVKDFADENDFPIFEAAWSVHMAKIMQRFCCILTEENMLYTQLSFALKNIIYFPEQFEVYEKQLLVNGYSLEGEYYLTATENIKHVGRKIDEVIQSIIENQQGKIICTEISDYIVILFSDYKNSELKSTLNKIRTKITELLKEEEDLQIYFAISQKITSLKQISEAYNETEKMLAIKEKLNFTDKIIEYKDIGLYKILFSADKEVLKQYYEETLGPLEQYDNANQLSLLAVVKMYIENNCSIQAVSDKMFIHRNTVNYKINKAQAILDIDISKCISRTKLQIAFMAKELLKLEGETKWN